MKDSPAGLSSNAEKLWVDTTTAYELRADELVVLEHACREVTLIERLDEILAASDPMAVGSMGQPVVNPLIPEIRQHRATAARLLASLKLPDDGGSVNQQRSAGQSSWAARARGA